MTFIGKGRTAELFTWEDGKVLKLFFEQVPDSVVEQEAKIAASVSSLEIGAPRFFGTVEVDGRRGVVYEYIPGKLLVKFLERAPFRAAFFARRMAREHHSIHLRHSGILTSERERFRLAVEASRAMLGASYDSLSRRIDALGKVDSVCHGDFHPDNILVDGDKYVTIDWMSAYSGDPAGDAARTYLLLSSPLIPEGIHFPFRLFVKRIKRVMAKAYLEEYLSASGLPRQSVMGWLSVVAAARLQEKIPGETDWLLGIIRQTER